jgi:iron complex outermembrane receptor protein
LEGRATLNIAAYHTTVGDYQTNIVSSLETAALRSYPSNIPAVRVQGLEADVMLAILDGLTVRASLAYADGIHKAYAMGPCPLELQSAATVACHLSGTRLPGLSRLAGSLVLDYRIALGSGEFVLHMNTSARSAYNNDTAGSQFTKIAGYSATNASLGYQFQNGWLVDVFARNLLNKDYITALTVQTGNSGLILGLPSDPRQVGVSLRLNK